MTQELEATPLAAERDTLMTTELVPEQILPKVMSTFGLTADLRLHHLLDHRLVDHGGRWLDRDPDVGARHPDVPGARGHGGRRTRQPVARPRRCVHLGVPARWARHGAFIGGYLSWVPVVLNAASSPAIVLQFLLLAFHAELGLTMSIILQLVILWAVVGLALAKLAANQTDHECRLRRVRRADADDLRLRR